MHYIHCLSRFTLLSLGVLAAIACGGNKTNDSAGSAGSDGATDTDGMGSTSGTETGTATASATATDGTMSAGTDTLTASMSDTQATGTSGVTATDSGGACIEEGTVAITLVVHTDECDHDQFVDLTGSQQVQISQNGDGMTLEILGDPGLAPVVRIVANDCSFAGSGTGIVAGFPDISIDWEGTVTTDGLSGTLTLGADGKLPGGCPIVFSY